MEGSDLFREIDKIVTAPYSVDISPLHLFARSASDEAIEQWSYAKLCQIPKLISYLLNPIHGRRGLETLERLAQAAQFAKAAAHTYPDLLAQMLHRAVVESNNSLTSRLCFRLLAARSVHSSGIPGDLPPFLEKLIRAICSFPTADLLHVLREIVSQQSGRVLVLASEDVIVDFIPIISINIGSAVCEEFCFKTPDYLDMKDNPEGSAAQICDWACKLLDHFDGLKALRTLHSIVARVMFFTSKNQNISMLTRTKTLDIVSETLERFKIGIIEEWAAENHTALEKVWRNAAHETLDFDARLAAFAVASKITSRSTHHHFTESVIKQLVPTIISADHPRALYLQDRASAKLGMITNSLCSLTQADHKLSIHLLHGVVQFIFVQCGPYLRPDLSTYTKTRNALLLLYALSKSMEDFADVYAILLSDFINSEAAAWKAWLQDRGNMEGPLEANCRGSDVCVQELRAVCHQLGYTVCIFLLRGACTTSYKLSTADFAFLQDKTASYVTKQEAQPCQYPADADCSSLESFTSAPTRAAGDWRQQLLSILNEHSRQSAKAVFEHVNVICKEFEQRCETIEQPLRQAEDKVAQLKEELDHVTGRLDVVEATNTATIQALKDADEVVNGKDSEIEMLKHEMDQLRESVISSGDKLTDQIEEISAIREAYANKITGLRGEAEDTKQDLERLNKADRLAFEEQLEDEKQQVEKLAATVAWLEQERRNVLEKQKAEDERHRERVQQMQAEHEEAYNVAKKQACDLYHDISGKNQEIIDLNRKMARDETELKQHTIRIDQFVQAEETWSQERKQLQERLRISDAKEKRVFAALQGLDSPSQASGPVSQRFRYKRQVEGETGLTDEDGDYSGLPPAQ